DRLTPRDHAYMMALIGIGYSDTTSYSDILWASEQFLRLAPDRAEAWTTVGDALNSFGELLGLSNSQRRAASAFRRAVELDPSFRPALEGAGMTGARSGDTATVRRFGGPYLSDDSAGAVAGFVRWRLAIALADSTTLKRMRAGFDTISIDDLARIGQLSQSDGVALEDADRAIALLLRRESRSQYRFAWTAEAATLALNRGRPAAGVLVRQEQRQIMRNRSNMPTVLQILDALYWDGDTTAGAVAARELGEITARLPSDTFRRHAYSCVLEQWRLAHGQPTTTRRTIAEMRNAKLSQDYEARSLAIVRGCPILLDALLLAAEK